MHRQQRGWRSHYWLFSGWLLALASTGLNMGQWFEAKAADQKELCQTVKQSTAVLSREQLTQLLTIPERANRKAIRNLVKEPYCTMPDLELRAGVKAEREAYPLAFDPETWLVVLYEGEEYAGYTFSIQR